ncbi:unnamed protein product [Prorocentrum cordatum]|uniref:Uncharacterized protein n=1 Tax=Prorocentrum cordatum TaxID=2364126 RepID=A0ABN9QV78_9DINO|nr:unnamed protein product [Polarella glacialis]
MPGRAQSGPKRKATFLRAYENGGVAPQGSASPGQRADPDVVKSSSADDMFLRSNTLDGLTEFKGPSDLQEDVVSDATQGIQLDMASSGIGVPGGDGGKGISNGSIRGFLAELKIGDTSEAATEAARASGHVAPIPMSWRASGSAEPAGSARTLAKCGPWTCIW